MVGRQRGRPGHAYWRELTPGELADLDGWYDGYAVPMGAWIMWFAWSRCWCDWSESNDDRSHDDYLDAEGYPFHLPSTEWNVPEPTEGAAA